MLALHSRVPGSRWVVTPWWLSGSEDLFCTVLFILTTSPYYLLLPLGPYHFCPFCAHLCMKCSLAISDFPEEISSLSHCIVFLYCINHWGRLSSLSLLFSGTLHSDGCTFPLPLCFCFPSFLSYFKASSDNHFALLHFFFLGMVLVTISSTMLQRREKKR